MNNSWEKKKKESQLQGEPEKRSSSIEAPAPRNVWIFTVCHESAPRERGKVEERDRRWDREEERRAEKQESNSDFTPAHAERARCGNGDICSVPVVVCLADGPQWWPLEERQAKVTIETSELNCCYMHTHTHTRTILWVYYKNLSFFAQKWTLHRHLHLFLSLLPFPPMLVYFIPFVIPSISRPLPFPGC